jgi:DNA-binding winged helix-turn-helix (wHTH) protein
MDEPLVFGPFALDPRNGSLWRAGVAVPLGYRAMLLLAEFARRPGAVVSKTDLMDAAWPGMAVEESNLSVQVSQLRKLLGETPEGGEWITTIPRVGYRFAERTLAQPNAS